MIRDFANLNEIDILEVGPVKISPRRLSMPYIIEKDTGRFSAELIYKYDEDVFDNTPDSENLACIIGSQLAFNYGLFAKKIRFNGLFSSEDRKFIKEMIDITSREILVKKILKPNIYIKDSIRSRLASPSGEAYPRAVTEFLGPQEPEKAVWHNSRESYAVLSSGGKDSLLSFSLLNELKKEVHPVFVNESGRHWFTSLNAYRYFKNHFPNTSRVWTNSDRVFNFFLKNLSFIRNNYGNMPSDDYPLRLWTVAVFIFGVLPLVRKRGIGRIIIGDEYDTTYRLSFKGITHYNGLYDQSRYFDNALTRYYRKKGYSIMQFSLLRNLSELMIQNILYSRYPDIQKHQVSCHSADIKLGNAKPCGHCEKCRRIAGMLTALGGDPRNCGYDDRQIKQCLSDFMKKGLHQEPACTQHALYLLSGMGLGRDSKTKTAVKPRHEVTCLRFDSEKSPFDTMPADIRIPIYRIFLQYCKKAVRKVGRVWVELDLFNEPLVNKPYRFEILEKSGKNMKKINSLPFEWGNLKWTEAKEYLSAVDIALLPVGSIEQHGPHLPLDTDAFDAGFLCREVALRCRDPRPLVLPLVPYGVSYHHEDFAGTVSIGPDTLSSLIYDIGMSLAKNGITKLVIINGHGGNSPALNMAAQKINRDAHIFTCVDSGESSDIDVSELIETPNDVHAGEVETSTSLANRQELVDISKAESFIPDFSSRYLNFTQKRSIDWYTRTARISKSGVLGDPTRASRKKGEAIWELIISNLVRFVEELKNLTLDEIYQRKY